MDADTTQGSTAYDDDSEDDLPDDEMPSYSSNGDFRLLETIGKGAYGVVYRAIWHNQVIAAKVIEHDESIGQGLITKDESFCPFERGDTMREGAPPVYHHARESAVAVSATQPLLGGSAQQHASA